MDEGVHGAGEFCVRGAVTQTDALISWSTQPCASWHFRGNVVLKADRTIHVLNHHQHLKKETIVKSQI